MVTVNADPYGLPQGATTTTGQLVLEIAEKTGDGGAKCFDTLVKAVSNVLEKPHEFKYRELRRGSQGLDQVDAQPAASMLLRRLGFQDCGNCYRLQPSGVRGSEVARLQCALNDLPHCSSYVERLGPSIFALGLEWRKPDGTTTCLPGPTFRERVGAANVEQLMLSSGVGAWGQRSAPPPAAPEEEEDDADLPLSSKQLRVRTEWLGRSGVLIWSVLISLLRTSKCWNPGDAVRVRVARVRIPVCCGGWTGADDPWSQSLRLPVNPLPADTLNNLQAQSDQVLRRVSALESSMTEVTRRLDDWTEVTRGGIADLRAEIGAVKLEQRFAQTLRSSGEGSRPAPNSLSAGASPQGDAQREIVAEELKKRLEVYEQKLSAIHSEHVIDASSMKERLEVALRESDNQMSRADELQALLKEEQGRRALLFARLEALEASVTDLRTNQREFAATPEVTESLLRAEMKKEVQRLRDDVGSDAWKKCEELDRRMAEYQQHQNIEAAALRNRLEAAVREVDRHTAAADALQRRCEDLESRLQKPEDSTIIRTELQKEITALRGEMEKRASQQLTQVEATNLELLRKQEASERQLLEWKQEMAAVRTRIEALEAITQATPCGSLSREESGETRESVVRLARKHSLTGSRRIVCMLVSTAKDLSTMREEHDQAISSLGSLTELVAKTTTSTIQKTEVHRSPRSARGGSVRESGVERIAADLTGKRRDFEQRGGRQDRGSGVRRSLIHHREQLEQDAKATGAARVRLCSVLGAWRSRCIEGSTKREIIANIKNLSPTLLAGAVGGGTLALALTAGGGLGPVVGGPRAQTTNHSNDEAVES
ncbi:unnamed protein product [Durusdinium trenchii]|uniref:Uncharacterized protein n=1 Tax=Durusdinium trenchii TaxID=1381693 RepID=A0ABP0T0V3_9DINO